MVPLSRFIVFFYRYAPAVLVGRTILVCSFACPSSLPPLAELFLGGFAVLWPYSVP